MLVSTFLVSCPKIIKVTWCLECAMCVSVFAVRCVQILPKRFISVAASLSHKQSVFFLLLIFLLYPLVGKSPLQALGGT